MGIVGQGTDQSRNVTPIGSGCPGPWRRSSAIWTHSCGKYNSDVMISGGMGRRAIDFFQQYGIKPATGGSGTVQVVLNKYLGGGMTLAEPCKESIKHAHEGGHHD